ncbi:MAG: thioredoxin family protein [Rhodobacteraceae bacterium]|nr:thioredoxin family protein [Paracoccaceae bacterium]
MTRLLNILVAFCLLALPALASDDVPLGDDGLHKPGWLRETFKDLGDDLAEANAEGKRLVLIWEQRGCIYCTKMHTDVFTDPEIDALIREKYFFVQLNLFGDVEVTDFDGTTLSEREMAKRWGIVFTPTLMFMPESAPEAGNAARGAVATMPGAFGRGTTYDLLTWIVAHGYDTDEHFQHYHARMINERRAKGE